MEGGTNGQTASGAAAGAEFFCGVLGDGVASALRWMLEGVWHRRCAGCLKGCEL